MQIMHPQASYQNLPPEDVFIALDEMGTQVGVGYLIYQYLPNRSPERPVNLYFEINSQPSGWYLILGALLARARQMRDQAPDQPARLYTRLNPGDSASLERCKLAGLSGVQYENLIRLTPPETSPRIPMGFAIDETPLNTMEEQAAFLARLRQNDILHIDPAYLQYLQRLPHFHALSLHYGPTLAAEILLAGTGDSCEIIAVYTVSNFRGQGMAKLMISRGMAVMSTEGVEKFAGVFVSLSEPQRKLAMAFQGADLQTQSVFPEMHM